MKAMHYDDGFDLMAPPTPEPDMSPSGTPPKLIHDATDAWWLIPAACAVSTALGALLIWGLLILTK